jgi:all-beta uncharacterized protein
MSLFIKTLQSYLSPCDTSYDIQNINGIDFQFVPTVDDSTPRLYHFLDSNLSWDEIKHTDSDVGNLRSSTQTHQSGYYLPVRENLGTDFPSISCLHNSDGTKTVSAAEFYFLLNSQCTGNICREPDNCEHYHNTFINGLTLKTYLKSSASNIDTGDHNVRLIMYVGHSDEELSSGPIEGYDPFFQISGPKEFDSIDRNEDFKYHVVNQNKTYTWNYSGTTVEKPYHYFDLGTFVAQYDAWNSFEIPENAKSFLQNMLDVLQGNIVSGSDTQGVYFLLIDEDFHSSNYPDINHGKSVDIGTGDLLRPILEIEYSTEAPILRVEVEEPLEFNPLALSIFPSNSEKINVECTGQFNEWEVVVEYTDPNPNYPSSPYPEPNIPWLDVNIVADTGVNPNCYKYGGYIELSMKTGITYNYTHLYAKITVQRYTEVEHYSIDVVAPSPYVPTDYPFYQSNNYSIHHNGGYHSNMFYDMTKAINIRLEHGKGEIIEPYNLPQPHNSIPVNDSSVTNIDTLDNGYVSISPRGTIDWSNPHGTAFLDSSLSVHLDENPSVIPRWVMLRMSDTPFNGGDYLIYPIRQMGQPYIGLDYEELNFNSSSNSDQPVEMITWTESWNCYTTDDWISINDGFPDSSGYRSINGNAGTRNINFNVSDSTEYREGTVMVRTYEDYWNSGQRTVNFSKPITVKQNSPEMDINKHSIDFTENGEVKDINVTSNHEWTITDDVDWITYDITYGSGNDTFNIDPSKNILGPDRTATITVTSSAGLVETIDVTQIGFTPELTVDSTSLTFLASGAMKTFDITSNVSWSLTDNVSWISYNITSGNGNATIEVDPSTYTSTTTDRTATITITTSGGIVITKIIDVIQYKTFNRPPLIKILVQE